MPLEIRTEAAIVLGSLAWGQDTNVASLLEVNAVPALLKGTWVLLVHFIEKFLSLNV